MPYPNEHSARLKEPSDFKEKPDWSDEGKFRRKSDGKLYGKIKVPATADVLWGQLKSQSGDSAAPQAIRFPTKDWTADEAKKWLKDNKVKHIKFEAASGGVKSIGPYIFPQRGAIQTRTFQCRADVTEEEPMPGTLQPIKMTPIVFGETAEPIFGFKERIEQTALDKALENPDTRMLINHDPNLLMGRTTSFDLPNGEKTLWLWKDEEGVHSKNYPPDVEYARALVSSAKRGDMTGGSFQFYIEKSRKEGTADNPTIVLEVINPLLDTSYVTFPFYHQTHIDMRTVMELMGVDYLAVRNIAGKKLFGKELTDGERRFIESGMKIFESLLLGESGDKLRGMAGEFNAAKVRSVETLRWQLEVMRTQLKEV